MPSYHCTGTVNNDAVKMYSHTMMLGLPIIGLLVIGIVVLLVWIAMKDSGKK